MQHIAPPTDPTQATIRRYQSLDQAARDRVRRLVCLSSCHLDLACAAVELAQAEGRIACSSPLAPAGASS